MTVSKKEEKEVKKDKTWAMNQVNNLDGVRIKGSFADFTTIPKDKAIGIISDMDEPEVEKIMELESKFKDKVVVVPYEDEIITLEKELEKKKNKISELEYELLFEKIKESKNSFYWFTAKKTPLVADVSYLSYEDTLYGFKGVPNYHFIENHDLRFITNCSLDDLIEQYK